MDICVYTIGVFCLGTKNISLKESAYEKLKALKREDESFSDVIERLAKKKTPSYDEFTKIISKDTAKAMKELKKQRKQKQEEIEEIIKKLEKQKE